MVSYKGEQDLHHYQQQTTLLFLVAHAFLHPLFKYMVLFGGIEGDAKPLVLIQTLSRGEQEKLKASLYFSFRDE